LVIRKIGNSVRINRKSAISLGNKMNNYNTHYALIKNSGSRYSYNIKTLNPENYNFGKKRKRLLRLKRALSVKMLVSK
jgi:hypothetical protein